METLRGDMVASMKAGDKVTKNVISSLIAAIKRVAIDEGVRDNVPDELVDRVILKELKSAKEQIDTCPADRTELLEEYKTNYDIINKYAPKLLSKEEVIEIIKTKFSEVLETKNKGMIMKTVMAEFKGKADGKVVSEAVGELC